jgi:low temperature requirement protein LtrA
MVAGIALVALGIEQVLELVGDTTDGELTQGLDVLPLVALYGGVAVFLIAHVAFKYRTWRHVSVRRLVVAAVIFALIPLAIELPALLALGLLTAVLVAMIGSEAVRYAEAREQVRHEDGGAEVHGDRAAAGPREGAPA